MAASTSGTTTSSFTSPLLLAPSEPSEESKEKNNATIKLMSKLIAEKEKGQQNPAKEYTIRGSVYIYQEDCENALKDLNIAIELYQNDSNSVLAYKRRALVYRIQGRYNKAIEDLNKAKGINDISTKIKEEISFAISELEKMSKPIGEGAFSLHRLQSGIGSAFVNDPGAVTKDPVAFFCEFTDFLEGNVENMPREQHGKSDTNYWRAFGFFRMAGECLTLGKEEEAKAWYGRAKEDLEQLILKSGDAYIPAFIYFMLAGAYYHLEFFPKALNNIDKAIAQNESEYRYYLLRSLVFKERGEVESAESDEKMFLDLHLKASLEESQRRCDELNKLIENYEIVKTDKHSYKDILNFLCKQEKVKVSGEEYKSLTPESLVMFFEKAKLQSVSAPGNITDPVSLDIYPKLENIGISLEPRRGETLPPIEVLYCQRAQCLSILAQKLDDRTKLEKACGDIDEVLKRTKGSNIELYVKALMGRAAVLSYFKEVEGARADLEAVLHVSPGNVQAQEGLTKLKVDEVGS